MTQSEKSKVPVTRLSPGVMVPTLKADEQIQFVDTKCSNAPAAPWWHSSAGIVARARELGLAVPTAAANEKKFTMKRLYARFVLWLIQPALDEESRRRDEEGDKRFKARMDKRFATRGSEPRSSASPDGTDLSR